MPCSVWAVTGAFMIPKVLSRIQISKKCPESPPTWVEMDRRTALANYTLQFKYTGDWLMYTLSWAAKNKTRSNLLHTKWQRSTPCFHLGKWTLTVFFSSTLQRDTAEILLFSVTLNFLLNLLLIHSISYWEKTYETRIWIGNFLGFLFHLFFCLIYSSNYELTCGLFYFFSHYCNGKDSDDPNSSAK